MSAVAPAAAVDRRPIAQPMRWLGFTATMLLVLAIQFRAQIFNGFSVLYGDRYDAAIVTTILEHWFNVVRGYAHWSQLNYFYPYTKTLGHTDGYFLLGMIYSAIRSVGADPFLASELCNVALRAVGFGAMFLACRRIFRIPFWWSACAAALFVLSNNATVHGQRLQLATVAFAPLMALLLWEAYQALAARRGRRLMAYGCAAGVFLGAWSVTCFYITWFFLFFTCALAVALLAGAGRQRLRALARDIASQKWPLLLVAAVAVLSLLPLLTVYLAKSQETGMRPFATVLGNTVPLAGVLQVGTENLLFGRAYNQLLRFLVPGYVPNGEYYNTGIAPLLFFLFAAGSVAVLRNARAPLLRAVCVATIATWLLALNVAGYSGWYLVYHLVPGAKALSVVSAYQIFLSIPVLVVAIHYLSSLAPKLPAAICALLVMLLVAEEFNDAYLTLVRADELRRVTLHTAPPPGCKVFFAGGWNDQAGVTPMSEWINNHYAHNVSAMLIAELIRLPTINGVASFNPPDWNFENPNGADNVQRIARYAYRHQDAGLCRLDLETKAWQTDWRPK
jgi:hypothetical protein